MGPTYPENIFTLVKSTVRYTCFGCLSLSHTHTRTHTRGHTRSPFTQKQAPTLPKAHTLAQTPCDETVWSNLQSPLLRAADGTPHGYLPQIRGGSKEHPKTRGQGGGRPGPGRFRIPLPRADSSSRERVNQQRCLLAGCPGLWQGYSS